MNVYIIANYLEAGRFDRMLMMVVLTEEKAQEVCSQDPDNLRYFEMKVEG